MSLAGLMVDNIESNMIAVDGNVAEASNHLAKSSHYQVIALCIDFVLISNIIYRKSRGPRLAAFW